MDHNEISMFMDVKLDIHDKRANTLKFKSWNRYEVKVEAIKCLPCFLRFTFQRCDQDEDTNEIQGAGNSLTVSINVPGVSISLATSRTKQFSYGLFWTQNRRDCFIYFALETEASCRRHMKWIKKSIKNLELFRKIFLEQRRLSRGPCRQQELQVLGKQSELGPLPKLPDATLNASTTSLCASRISDIYEEIFDGQGEHIRLSTRFSRSSIASGIYEEMKPSMNNFQSIVEEPPAVPPLPAHRKRINTFENDPQCLLGELLRSNTDPESELAKKKKYKNMLDNIFGSARQKRAESVSECEQQAQAMVLYENAPPAMTPPSTSVTKLFEKRIQTNISKSQRNSFSSPDLSKLNLLDSFNEEAVVNVMPKSEESIELLDLSLDESIIQYQTKSLLVARLKSQLSKADSLDSLNISEQLPNNFNFSACNTSTSNLIGAHGAVPQINPMQKNKILVDDLTGYCIMAPIVKKTSTQIEDKPTQANIVSTSSGYSTGSHCSSTSSCNTAADEAAKVATTTNKNNESGIYEAMVAGSMNGSSSIVATGTNEFVEHLYENLLAVKAAQELEAPNFGLSTSTPTDSPQLPALPQKGTPKSTAGGEEEPEDFYQTPRKSIISVDDKIPSYYPNSCDTMKTKRKSRSPDHITPTNENKSEKSTGGHLRQLVNIKMRRERKENLYISSPQQQVIDQRQKSSSKYSPLNKEENSSSSVLKSKTQNKKPAAHKISDNVYAVTHPNSKKPSSTTLNNNNDGIFTDEMKEKLQSELRQLALLQNIDFKFDDSESPTAKCQQHPMAESVSSKIVAEDDEYEHRFQAAESATRLLKRYATLAKFGGNSPKKTNQKQLATHMLPGTSSTNSAAPAMSQSTTNSAEIQLTVGKKFASLPRFKKIDFSPLKMKINNVLQRHQQQQTSSPPPQPQPQPKAQPSPPPPSIAELKNSK